MSQADVLIYAEDPGAANYVAQLPAALAAAGISSILLSDGLASNYLKERGVISKSLQPNDTAASVIDNYKPRLVLVGTSENTESFGLKLIKQAKQNGISSAGVIDLKVNADRRFRGESENPLQYAPDWLLVPDQDVKLAYEALAFTADKIVVCGHPHYDYIRQVADRLHNTDRSLLRKRVLPEAPLNKPVIVFVAEPASKLNPALTSRSAEYTLSGRNNSNWRTEIVLQELLDAFAKVKVAPYLVLRLHPKSQQADFAAYEQNIDLFSSGGDPLEVISLAHLIVGMTSMLLQEATLMEKPTLSIVPRTSEKEWLPSIKSGLTPSVSTRIELETIIEQWAHNWQTGVSRIHKNLPDTKTVFPAGSMERVINFIAQQMEQTKTRNLV